MKRREFLAASASVAGAIATRSVYGAQPCPQPSMSVAGGSSVTQNCVTGSGPAWFTSMSDNTWGQIATTATVAAAAPSQYPGGTGQNGVMLAWSGGVVDTLRQELQLPAQGGHSDYYGNEVYALALNTAAPGWTRVSNPRLSFGGTGVMDDGSPRSNHGASHIVYAANIDRTILTGLSGTAPLGDSHTGIHAFNRATNTWTRRATPPSGFGDAFLTNGGGVYDPTTGMIWLMAAQATNSVARYNPQTDTHTLYSNISINRGYSGSLAISPARGFMIYISGSVVSYNGTFVWFDLNNPTAGWRSPAAVTGSPVTGNGPGMQWHNPSNCFLCWNGSTTISKLTPPSNLSTGTWAWSSVAPAAGNSVSPTARQGNGTYGRFNLVQDLGGSGRDCLVLVNSTNQATYVYKVPASGM